MKTLNNNFRFRTWGLLALTGILASCTDTHGPLSEDSAAGRVVRISAAPFATESGTASEDALGEVHAYLFEEGFLTRIYESLPVADNGCKLPLERLSGRLYVVADARPEVASGRPAPGLPEAEWLDATVGVLDAATAGFAVGSLDLRQVSPASGAVPLTLTRGMVRFDLRLRVAGSVEVDTFTLLDAALAGYLLPQDPVSTPAGAGRADLTTSHSLPLTEDTPGVAYLCEQDNADLRVRVGAVIDGKRHMLESALPRPLVRNRIYTVTLRKDIIDTDVSLVVESWNDGGNSDLSPDWDGRLTVDRARSTIPGDVRIEEDGTALVLPYTDTEVLLAVACDSQLEVVPQTTFPLTVEEVSTGSSPADMNLFRIRKSLYAPNRASAEIPVLFRRKGLSQIYPEDRILLRLTDNPTRIEGDLNFDNDAYTVDFGRYVDNELGVFVLPAEKELVVEFDEGEDPWVLISAHADRANAFRVLGGWRPNDPTANGRPQAARLVVRNRADGSQREVYTVVRRNWGLPVTWFHGVWWCKYNARGNSRRFEDQVLSSADPAAKAGMSVYDYLANCTAEEFFDLWGWAYQGDSGQGLRVVEQDGKAVLEGFSTNMTAHINKLPPDALSPDGYELPSMEEYNRVFDATDYVWIMWSGSHKLRVPWEGHSLVRRSQQRRHDIVVGSLQLTELISVGTWSPDFPEHEAVTWYGPAAQWNADGIKHSNHYNNILFGVYSPEGSGWYIAGALANLYMMKNGAGANDTRILRFKKSPVEYIYGESATR